MAKPTHNDVSPRPVRWIGSSKDDLSAFPDEVRRRVGGGLWDAQCGIKARFAKPLRGFGGAGVLEIVDDFGGNTYRVVYTVSRLHPACVPKEIEARRSHAKNRSRCDQTAVQARKRGLRTMARKGKNEIPVTAGSDNIFADLGLPEPEEELTKAQLAGQIRQIIGRRRLTQASAAALMGIDQPKVSAVLNGRLANFSSDRLMRLLTALGQDVEIIVKTKPRNRARGRIRVVGEVHA